MPLSLYAGINMSGGNCFPIDDLVLAVRQEISHGASCLPRSVVLTAVLQELGYSAVMMRQDGYTDRVTLIHYYVFTKDWGVIDVSYDTNPFDSLNGYVASDWEQQTTLHSSVNPFEINFVTYEAVVKKLINRFKNVGASVYTICNIVE